MPDARIAFFYALNFGGLGIALPYLAPWLASRGVDPATTGAIAASPSIAMLATTFAFGALADRLADWRTAILIGAWATLGAYALLFVVDGARGIWLVWTLGGVLMLGTIPIVDGAALSLARRRGTAWGRVRAFGSAGFIVGLTAGGVLMERFGPGAFVPVLVAGALGRALAALALPRFGREPTRAAPDRAGVDGERADGERAEGSVECGAVSASAGAVLRHPGFLAVIAGAALINASHAFLYTFAVLHWTSVGISESLSSALWTASIVAEVVLLWRFADIARRLSARGCLLFAGAVAALRWTLTANDPGYAALVALQVLHAVSFGLAFVATASFIARRVDDAVAARAQALAATLATAAMAVMTLASGALYEAVGAHGYRAMAGVCALGMALVAASYRTDLVDRPVPA